MAYGFKCLNQDGITQIDETYTNFQVDSQGTINSGASIPAGWLGTQNRVLVRPNAYNIRISLVGNTASGATLSAPIIWASSPVSLKYVVLKPMPNITYTQSGYGMIVKDAAGSIKFHSQYPVAKLISALNVPIAATTTHSFTLPTSTYPKYFDITKLFSYYFVGQFQEIYSAWFASETSFKVYTNATSNTAGYTYWTQLVGMF